MLVSCNQEVEEYRVRRGKEYAQVFKAVAHLELNELTSYQQLLQIPLAAIGTS